MFFKSKRLKQNNNGNSNVNSARDTIINNYVKSTSDDIIDQGIIDELIIYAIKKCKEASIIHHIDNSKFLHVDEKIHLNFKAKEEIEEVRIYFKYAYTKITIIDNKFAQLTLEQQNDLHSYIFSLYVHLKTTNSNIEILRELFNKITPSDKINIPEYTNIAKAFVLFFFDDCTIFEKTEIENILKEC